MKKNKMLKSKLNQKIQDLDTESCKAGRAKVMREWIGRAHGNKLSTLPKQVHTFCLICIKFPHTPILFLRNAHEEPKLHVEWCYIKKPK